MLEQASRVLKMTQQAASFFRRASKIFRCRAYSAQLQTQPYSGEARKARSGIQSIARIESRWSSACCQCSRMKHLLFVHRDHGTGRATMVIQAHYCLIVLKEEVTAASPNTTAVITTKFETSILRDRSPSREEGVFTGVHHL